MSGKKERITVSLDPGVAARLKAAAEQAGAASVSEYVEGALDARMVRDQWLARWRDAAGEVDPEALAYARRAAVPPQARALLELFLDAPAVVVEDLTVSAAGRAGVRAHPAHQAGRFDVAAAHAVDVAIARGLAILTAEPGPLRAIHPDVEIEKLPEP